MENEERWTQVIDPFGARTDYEVSTLGRVRSLKRGREGRIMRGGEGPNGTTTTARTVWLMDSYYNVAKPRRVDQVVARAFLGEAPQGTRVIHKNGFIWDDRLENLEYGTTAAFEPAPPPPIQEGLSVAQARKKQEAAQEAVRKAMEILVEVSMELAAVMERDKAQKGSHGLG